MVQRASQITCATLRSLLDLDGRVIRVEIIKLDRRYAYLDTGFKENLRFVKKNIKPSQLVREAPVRSQGQIARQISHCMHGVQRIVCTQAVSKCVH